MKLEDLVITDEVYEASERAIMHYVDDADAPEAASGVLHAAIPLDRAAELRDIAAELEVVAGERAPDPGRWTGLAEGIQYLRVRADRYDGGAS
ncbi:hypothetical protein BH24ACT15_BH24ACT15_36890 [soil metagenome]